MRLFPFSAIVGQELLKKGLLANAVDPDLDLLALPQDILNSADGILPQL